MAQFKRIFYQDLTKKRIIRHCEDVVFGGDNLSDKIGVYLYDNGEPYAGGGTVSGTVINSRGQTVPITTCEISGNLVTVTLEEAALAVHGIIGVYVKLTSGQQIATVLSAMFTAMPTETDQTIDPGTIIPSVSQLITDIETARDSIPPVYTELLAAVAPTFSASTAYTAGSYVWQGGSLYRFTADHAAGSWTGTDAAAAVLGSDVSNLKSAIKNGNLYALINQRQMWNPFEVVKGGRYYCDGTYNANSNYCYLQFPVVEGQVYYFATPDPTSASGKKTGTAHYVCPVKSDGTYYYDNATAVTWTDQYTVPVDSGITSLIVSIPLSRLGPDGLYSITSDPLSSANKYSPRYVPSFGTIAETVALSNLLDGTTWTNSFVSVVTGLTTANDGYRTSDYISVVGGNYIVSTWQNQRRQMFSCAVYDVDKNVIAAESVTGDGFQRQSGYFKLPAGAAYIRVTYTAANYDAAYNYLYQYQYNIGYVTKNFSIIKDAAIPGVLERITTLENTGKSKWAGKKFLAIGDSQTAQGKWEPFVASTLGMVAYIKGFSGRTVAVSNPNNTGDCISSDYNIGQIDTYINDGHDDFDVVLIMGGTNDWGYDGVIHEGYANILVGTDADTANTTFKGALKKLVKHFNDTYPTKTVVIMSNIGGRTRDPATDTILTNMTAPLINANGYCQATFAQAAKEIAEYIGIPYIDVYSCGITIYNSATYLEDGLHINSNTGAKLVANAVINGLQSIQPYNE